MPAFADLILADGLATPVNRAFKAKAQIDGRWTYWYENASGIALSYPSVTTKTLFAKGANGATKHEINVRIPGVDTSVPGNPRSSYFHQVYMVVTTSDRGTRAEKADLWAYSKNLANNALYQSLVVDSEPQR